MLRIENLHVESGRHAILKNLNLAVKRGERHIVFGPNASGKSTLASTIMGMPSPEVSI